MAAETGMLVQKLRLQHGWSQEELAALCTLSVRTIQRIERGQTGSLESLKALAAVFEIDFLALKEPDMNKPNTPSVSSEETIALAHVRRVKGFYVHFVQFMIFVGTLTLVNIATDRHYLWVVWVALGWGSGVLVHGLKVFDKVPFLTARWEKRQVERRLGHQL